MRLETGLTIDLIGKRLEVLKEIAPAHTHIGFVSMQKGISPSLDQVDQIKFDAAAATAKALGLTIAWRPLPNSEMSTRSSHPSWPMGTKRFTLYSIR